MDIAIKCIQQTSPQEGLSNIKGTHTYERQHEKTNNVDFGQV